MRQFILLLILFSVLPIHSYAQACFDPILEVGDTGIVLGETSNNVRSEPSTSGAVVGGIEGGGRFTVIELGDCDNGIRWINVEAENGFAGWTAESVSDEAFVRRIVILDTDFMILGEGDIALNADGTKLVVGNQLYDAQDLNSPSTELPSNGSSIFSPIDPDLLFMYVLDSKFTLIDIVDMSIIWSTTMREPSGIGGGIYMQDAYFTNDGQYIIFSATEPESSWTILDTDTLDVISIERSYYGETVAIVPNSSEFIRYISSIYAPENPPSIFRESFMTDNPTAMIGNGARVAQLRDMLMMPDGRMVTWDSEGVFDLWSTDLRVIKSLDLPSGELIDRVVNDQYLVVVQDSTQNADESILTVLSANSLEPIAQIPIRIDGERNELVRLVFHPDGSLGLKVGSLFRWIPFNQFVDGTVTSLQISSLEN